MFGVAEVARREDELRGRVGQGGSALAPGTRMSEAQYREHLAKYRKYYCAELKDIIRELKTML